MFGFLFGWMVGDRIADRSTTTTPRRRGMTRSEFWGVALILVALYAIGAVIYRIAAIF